jgi:uncharacterized protein (TIGR02453 family)
MHSISRSTFDFLKDIKKNNDRDWFLANRSRYDEARKDFDDYVQAIIDELVKFDPILKGLEVKSCTYRINRDIRFSPDKTIYKTHLGAYIVRGGKKNGDRYAGYYFHVEPGNSMIAGGAWFPSAEWLSGIREKISEEGDKLLKILNDKEFKEMFGELDGEKLKSAPKGYPKDHPYIELLKYKGMGVVRYLSDNEISEPGGLETVMAACRLIKPFNDFFNDRY